MTTPLILDIRIRLEGIVAERFRAIKESRGLMQNTEVLRQLITEAAKELEVTA